MKKILSTLALLFLAVGAQAQNAYPLFVPSNGIMKGDVNTFVTTSATGADVTSLFSGTCNAAAFLRGDASCFDLLGAANTWSNTQSFTQNGANARFNGADPRFLINETDAGVDQKNWLVRAVADQFNIATATDASPFSAINSAFTIARSGTGVGQISLTSGTATVVLSGSSATATVGASGLPSISGVSTNGQFLNNDANPSYYINESDAAADEKIWRLNAAAGDLIWSTRTDVNGGGSTFMTVGRTGTTVDSLALAATSITLNGIAATDYARLSQSNTFTGSTQQITNTGGARLVLRDPDATANEQCFFTLSQTDVYSLYASEDANCTSTTNAIRIMAVDRTGTQPDNVTWPNGTSRFTQTNTAIPTIATSATDITSRSVNTAVLSGVQVTGSGAPDSSISHTRAVTSSAAPTYFMNKARGSVGTLGAVVADDTLGILAFSGYDGTNFSNGARIFSEVDGTPGANDMPGRLVFSTSADGSNSSTERLRIAANGAWGLGGATFGSAGNVLTSNGSGGPPTWTSAAAGDAVLAANQTFTGQNTFSNGTLPIKVTGPQIEIENTAPILQYDETDAAANERNWLARTSGGLYALSTATDAAPTTAVENILTIDRAGTTSGRITWSNLTDGLFDIKGTNTGNTNVSGYEMLNSASTRTGFVGDGSSSNADIFLQADTAGASLRLNTGSGGNAFINDLSILGTAPATSAIVVRVVSAQYKGGNTDRSSTAVLAADPTLTGLSVPEAGNYLIEGQLCFTGPVSGAGGIKFRYEFSGSVSGGLGIYTGSVNGAVVASGGFLALDANQISFATITTATGDCLQFNHTMIATGAGTLDLQWAQNASNANATRLSAGSMVKVTRIG